MKVSIIIPTYNEEQIVAIQLQKLISKIGDDNVEVILVDAGIDNTSEIALKFSITVTKSDKGRAIQMNKGARCASGDVFYFLHLDTDVPSNFIQLIQNQIKLNNKAGCFQMKFDDEHWLMQFYGWCTQLPFSFCRGGDQSLFITKELFNEIGGFDDSLLIMEDIDIINRIKKKTKFHVLKKIVITSARKYNVNGRLRLQLIFGIIHLMYGLGYSQEKIIQFYSKNIR